MLSLSTAAITEKNKLANTGVWLVLVQITLLDTTVIRVCSNTENIQWPTAGGNAYTAFPFEIEEIGDSSKGEKPKVNVRIGNPSRVMEQYMEQSNGGVGSEIILRVVHSAHLDLASAEIELTFECVDAKADSKWAHFTLGAPGPHEKRWPRSRIMKHFCRYKVFKGTRCGYAGGETVCDRTLVRCKALSNSTRFGGASGAGQKGIY